MTRLPVVTPDLRIDRDAATAALATDKASPGLFAFPAQSNFSGVRHPLALVSQARAAGWHVLLDAAAFVPTSPLDIAAVGPDFVCVSFYKMFGYPTGVGCLIARRGDFTFDDLRADVREATGGDVGAIRASFGIASDFSDAWRLGRFLERFLDRSTDAMGTEPRRDGER